LARKPGKPSSKRGSGRPSGAPAPVKREAASPPQTVQAPLPRRRPFMIIAAAIALLVAGGSALYYATGGLHDLFASRSGVTAAAPTFVGSETCAGCHRSEATLWRTSQHKHAMAHASDATVLGDFNNASFDYHGVTSRFLRKDGKFLVETDGSDGKLAAFEVKYTFGLDPLQQYLVEFPDGRVQALSLAWDARPKDQGGQRWFHLYPDEDIKHDDVLHWTKLNQNWNFMCAECHSTGVRKNYDAAEDRFATRFAEISVGCEACHGEGSRHLEWARAKEHWLPFAKPDDPRMGLLARFDERRGVAWPVDPKSGNAARNFTPATTRKEVETCGRCHARRGEFSEDWIPGRPLSDTHAVAPLSRGLYYADGEMRDEVYNYGSFKQSRMFAAGVTCSDCHDPHSAMLRARGAEVCSQCHAPEKYASIAHRHHEGVDPAPTCISCHMPARTYMVVDVRHDHSFRIPRPDLTATLGTPNACNDCHTDKSAGWAAETIANWHGPNRKGFQNYAAAFRAAWDGGADASARLAAVAANQATPAFARAGALAELHASPANLEIAETALADPDPIVRIGGLDMIEGLPPDRLLSLAAPLLSDPIRGVRIRAAALLAAVPPAAQPPADREHFAKAAAEFEAAQRLNADRHESRSALGTFYARQRRFADAEAEYKAALALSPRYVPASINLADLYRQTGRDGDGEATLRAAIAATPQDAGLHHAHGLALTRLKKQDEALAALARAAALEPDRSRYAYVYAVGLNSAGRGPEALTVLKDNLAKHPDDRDTLLALVTFNRDAGDIPAALEYAGQLARLAPTDRGLADLVADLRRRQEKKE
jgi:predicted CXXCH cytochrome family protein